MLLIVTLAPPRLVTSLPSGPKLENSTVEPSFRLLPKIAAIEPGATGAGLGAKLALLTTPPSFTEGGNDNSDIFSKKASRLPALVWPGKAPRVSPEAYTP